MGRDGDGYVWRVQYEVYEVETERYKERNMTVQVQWGMCLPSSKPYPWLFTLSINLSLA